MAARTNLHHKTYQTEATVAPDGSLVVETPPLLPFKPGEKVSLVISAIPESNPENAYPLRGSVLHYEDPFGSATPVEEWEALQ